MPLPENLAANPDEFLDYYELLDQPADATTASIRGRINDLYADAQQNRDHRNAQKRREYLLWLDLLPGARTVLTDEAKRAKYNDYRQKLLAGETVPPYAQFIRELEGKPAQSQDQGDVLGLRDDTPKTPVATPSTNLPKSGDGGGDSGSSTAGIAALVVLIIAAVAGYVVRGTDGIAIGLIAGAILGGIIFMVMRGGNKIAR
jgi:hypothetical protein